MGAFLFLLMLSNGCQVIFACHQLTSDEPECDAPRSFWLFKLFLHFVQAAGSAWLMFHLFPAQ